MRIGFIQFHPEFGNVRLNVARAVDFLQASNADLVVLPELFNSGYLFTSRQEVEDVAEEIPTGLTTRQLAEVASDNGLFIVAGLAERSDKVIYNTSVLVGPGGVMGLYRKAHLFKDEPKWFAPGNTAFDVYDIGPARIGMMICFDWIFPEAARTLSLKGSDIICHPSNLMLPYCQKAMTTRSLENGVFTITCNRIGMERRGSEQLDFTGMSQIVDPKGNILASEGRDDEKLLIVDIDPLEARDKRMGINRIFEERRIDLYEVG